ncbi:unnamed protein product [Periconia digitata]|uniref:Secreted protein n=1 Tax=Periconia digitata TaxID=1303443 RepID=A0A9W4U2E3_9PLEO|nr:unnamed protein product [Periconia digitata]
MPAPTLDWAVALQPVSILSALSLTASRFSGCCSASITHVQSSPRPSRTTTPDRWDNYTSINLLTLHGGRRHLQTRFAQAGESNCYMPLQPALSPSKNPVGPPFSCLSRCSSCSLLFR